MLPPSSRGGNRPQKPVKSAQNSSAASVSADLNAPQAKAVRHGDGPLLIAAGAGSGKTKTLTSRLLALLDRGVPGEELVAITFTNKAAEEMRDRVAGKIRGVPPFIGTFHSFGARILRNHAAAFGRTAGYSIYDGDDSLRVIKQLVKERPTGLVKELGPAPLGRELSAIKNECRPPALPTAIRPPFLARDDAELPEPDAGLAELFLAYEERLRAQNAFDFDDLIQKPVRLFLENQGLRALYERRFRHVLVDEYQDINTAQYALIRLLAERHGNVCVVGDDNQAIYSFRGADFRNFLNFDRDFPDAKVVLLEENYRSTSNIIRAASEVIGNNTLQKPKRLWTKNPEGVPIRTLETSGPDEEAERIAEFAAKDPARTAVLYRTNAQSRALEQALLAEGVPYAIFGGLRFSERKEVKDLVAALRYAQNPRDAVALDRMDKAFLKAGFRLLRDELPAKAEELAPAELLGFVLKETDYLAWLRRNFRNADERTENIQELIAFALRAASLGDFLERISLLEGNAGGGEHPGAVRLMTIHLSKGLEFDRVAIAGAVEGYLPHQMSLAALPEIEEERRLMYVAMTRARRELMITFYGVGSRFLYEIPQELIEFESTVASGRGLEDDEERYITLN